MVKGGRGGVVTMTTRLLLAVAATSFLLLNDAAAFVPSRQLAHSLKQSSFLSMSSRGPREDETKSDGGVQTYNPVKMAVGQSDSALSPDPDVEELMQQQELQESNKQLGIWAARGLLMFIAILWGTNFAAVKYLETLCFHPPCVHPPSEAALLRFGLAATLGIPLLIGQRKDIILAGLECGLWISLGYITQAIALETIPSGKCAFICSLTVVVVPVFSALLYGKPIKPLDAVAAAVALSGVGILEGLIDTNALLGIEPAAAESVRVAATESAMVFSSSVASSAAAAAAGPLGSLANVLGVNKGDIIALGQPLGFGYAFLRVEHYVDKFKDDENTVLTITAAQCMAVGLVSLLWVLYDFHGTIPNMGYMVSTSTCLETVPFTRKNMVIWSFAHPGICIYIYLRLNHIAWQQLHGRV
jgi:drug/metabolite transporter (DMT)-like permease